MAALVEDRSPLQLGAEGSYQGVHFALIGRLQVKYSQGLWNEWHLLFDDMRTGWLSEAGGEYVLTFVEYVGEQLPAFGELKIGQRFLLAARPWTVSNIETAECVAGQGELPFTVGAGYPLAAVDLRNGANFATLDYSATPPLLFVGAAVDFKSLRMSNLRHGQAIPLPAVEARVFRCPACASPMAARSREILAVGCAACGTVVDSGDDNYRILSKALGSRDEAYQARLALGSKGVLEGQAVEVIGFLVKQWQGEGVSEHWAEYLLAAENATYRWLTEYQGHWNIAEVLSNPPAVSGAMELADVRWNAQNFRHFATTATAEVIQVAGEFTWRVRRGESNRVVDYVAPPLMLSRESTANDLNWSLGRYVEPEVIAAAFKRPGQLPEPQGVFANQPNPWAETHRLICRLFWKLAVLALAAQALLVLVGGGQTLLRQDFEFSPGAADEQVTREFAVSGRPRKITVRNTTSLDNNWLALNLTLVNKTTGAAWPVTREVAYYSGNDGGESWSEGKRDDAVVFLAIPPGTYYLTVDPDLATEKPVAVRDRLEVQSGGVGWSNFVLLLLFLAAFPVFTRLRHTAFEVRRWAASDHAPVSSDEAEGDD
ncbi:MAG: hypothetical protein H6R15_1445 [Proteobacteria bacterium]|nr:hypothetical protein [Pseudomonadota bacterium]